MDEEYKEKIIDYEAMRKSVVEPKELASGEVKEPKLEVPKNVKED